MIDAVIWATGYRPDYSWIELPVFDDDGRLRHRRGVTDVPGLYFLGLTWQHTRGSALLGWVKDDAEFIAKRIAERQQSKAAAREGTPARTAAASTTEGANGMHHSGSQSHSEIVELPRETKGLPEARKTELVELRDGDEFSLEIVPVKKRIGDATVRMLPTTDRSPDQR